MTRPTTIVTGSLLGTPTEEETRAGATFVTARLRENSKSTPPRTWQVSAFSGHARKALIPLALGDTITVEGPFEAKIVWGEGADAPNLAWRITAVRIEAEAEQSVP